MPSEFGAQGLSAQRLKGTGWLVGIFFERSWLKCDDPEGPIDQVAVSGGSCAYLVAAMRRTRAPCRWGKPPGFATCSAVTGLLKAAAAKMLKESRSASAYQLACPRVGARLSRSLIPSRSLERELNPSHRGGKSRRDGKKVVSFSYGDSLLVS